MKRKSAAYYSAHHYCAYPNAADTNYYKKKLLEITASLLSGAALTLSIVMLTVLM